MRKLIALLTVFVLVMPAMASAEVTRQEVSDAEAKANAVSRRLESELGALDAAIIEQSQLEERIAALQREVTSRDREVALARVAAKERARAMYVTAGTQRAHTLATVDEITDNGTRAAYLDALIVQDVSVVNQLTFLQGDRDRLQAEIRILVARQLEVQSELEASSSVILGELEAANEEFDLVLTEWEKQEAERRRREEAERQRRAAAAAAASAAASAAAAAASNYTSSAATSARGRTCPVRGPHSFRNSWGEPRPGGRSHHGVDMVAANGTRLVAAESGTVYSPNWHYAGGIGLYLRGLSGDVYYYAHLKSYAAGIVAGSRVGKGQVIGYVGTTGNAAVPHLHLGYQPGGGPLTNPYQLMVKLCR